MQRKVGERMKFPPRWWATGERNIRIADEDEKYTHLKSNMAAQ